MGEAAKPLLFQGVKGGCNVVLLGRRGTSWHFHMSANASKDVEISFVWEAQYFCKASNFQQMSSIFCGRRSALETSIVILRGRRSGSDVWRCVFLRIALSGLCQVVTTSKSRGRCGTLRECNFAWQWMAVAVLFGADLVSMECDFAWHVWSFWHSTLYTVHSTLHTLHLTLHTLHSTLYTLHFTLCTLKITLYTLHSTLCTLHSRLYTLHSALCTLYSTLYTLHSTLRTPHFPL